MISFSRQFGRTLSGWIAVSLAMACSACATMPPSARLKSTDHGPVQAIYKETSGQKKAGKGRESDIQQLKFTQSPAGETRVRRDNGIQQIAATDENVSPDYAVPVGGMPPGQCPPNDCFVESCPPEPRWAAAGPSPLAPGMMACDACNVSSIEKYPDEYLCDGGDREIPVHYDSFSRLGLDTEDTVLEFTDREGNERMRPSNRVCIYAPRFASVRTVSRPHEEYNTNEVAGVGQLASSSGMHSRLKASNSTRREMTGRLAVRSRASGLEAEALQGTVSQLRSPSIHDKLLNIYEALTFVRFGRVDDSDTARLNFGIQAASAWTREEYPVMTAKTDMPLEGHFEQSTTVITAIDEKKEAENLRIVKLADKKTAVPGDEILFTIRYDNLGGREVHHIRVVDNLTPRLVYVDDSATSDRAGRLVLQDNGEGSQVLVWELDAPLPGKTGGVVTFKARVR
jgi:uncharacterized repeat protein (TIGR01451 family)